MLFFYLRFVASVEEERKATALPAPARPIESRDESIPLGFRSEGLEPFGAELFRKLDYLITAYLMFSEGDLSGDIAGGDEALDAFNQVLVKLISLPVQISVFCWLNLSLG